MVMLLASRRSDVVNIRTIAGNVDTLAFTKHHQVSKLEDSLNPADFKTKTFKIPQIHFVGQKDKVVPAKLIYDYETSLPAGHCSRIIEVPNTDHVSGWPEHWSGLISRSLPCT